MNDKTTIDDIDLSKTSKEVVEDESFSTLAAEEDVENLSHVAPKDANIEPPNGGFAAWLVVFGAFCVSGC